MLPPELSQYKKIYVFSLDLRGAGFGALILQTLNQVRYCEREGYLPVVNYDASCQSYFYDPDVGGNVWAYYFEPLVPPFSYAYIQRCCEDPSNPICEADLITLPTEEVLRISERDPRSIYTYTFADWRHNPPDDLAEWYAVQRRRGRKAVARYIRVRSEILERVDLFAARFCGERPLLGVHIRGTDMTYAPPVSPAEYFPSVDRWLAAHPDGKLYLATDQQQYLEVFLARYRDLVVYSDCLRSTDDTVPLFLPAGSPYQKGLEALFDVLMLSRSDFLLKGASSIGEMALYFNPSLTCEDFAISKTKAFGQSYERDWNGSLPEQTVPAWRLVGKTDLNRLSPFYASQTRWQKVAYRLRPYGGFFFRFSNRVRWLYRRGYLRPTEIGPRIWKSFFSNKWLQIFRGR